MGKNNKLFLLMPHHRRNAGAKLVPPKVNDDRNDILGVSSVTVSPPRHVTLPRLSAESELMYEAQTLLLFVLSMGTQYLNLYRTVFWLPQSYTNVAMFSISIGLSILFGVIRCPVYARLNCILISIVTYLYFDMQNFHLIDLNAVQFCTLFIGRPFVLHLANIITSALPLMFRPIYEYTSSLLIHILCIWGHVRCSIHIYANHGITGILCISYPIVIYMLMYSPNLLSAYESSKTANTLLDCLISGVKSILLPTKFSSQQPLHQCTSSAETIRSEVDKLKSTFNERLKFILFRSLLIAYYSSFVPLCFAQSQLYYDVSWTAQHVVICWMSAFLMLTSHIYSPQFYDILHRSALHLGKWQKLETRNTLVPCNVWSESILYGHGVVVKYSKEYFKSEGTSNCAEPGNQSHLRYFIVFSNPIGGFGTLLGLLTILIVLQMVLLIRALEWYKLISMSLMTLINSLTVFRLMRSFYVLKEVYKIESRLQNTNNNSN